MKNKKVYRFFGIFFLIQCIVFVFSYLALFKFEEITFQIRNYIPTPLVFILLSLFLGIFYIKFSLGKIKENKLIKSSLFFAALGIFCFFILLFYSFTGSLNLDELEFIFFFGLVPSIVLFGITSLLIIINWVRNLLKNEPC